MVLATRRLLLRRWLAADREPFAALNADAEVMAHFPAPLTREASDALAAGAEAHLARHGWGLWAVQEQETGRFAGFTGLSTVSFPGSLDGAVEVGWRLARAAWGKGYATEAAEAALEVAFLRLGLDEVVSFTATSNVRSLAVMRRLGMTQDGTFEHPRVPAGSPLRVHALFRLSRLDWLARRTT